MTAEAVLEVGNDVRLARRVGAVVEDGVTEQNDVGHEERADRRRQPARPRRLAAGGAAAAQVLHGRDAQMLRASHAPAGA